MNTCTYKVFFQTLWQLHSRQLIFLTVDTPVILQRLMPFCAYCRHIGTHISEVAVSKVNSGQSLSGQTLSHAERVWPESVLESAAHLAENNSHDRHFRSYG